MSDDDLFWHLRDDKPAVDTAKEFWVKHNARPVDERKIVADAIRVILKERKITFASIARNEQKAAVTIANAFKDVFTHYGPYGFPLYLCRALHWHRILKEIESL